MKLENPFQGMAYITEKKVKPEKVLERYSTLPLKYLLHYLDESINSFFVGRIGVGKTMILSLFDLPYQQELYSNDAKIDSRDDRENIIGFLPKEVIGIYSNIDSPYIQLTRFQGSRLQNKENWMRVFADYYGHVLVRNLISTIEELSKLKNWRQHNNVRELDINILDSISVDYAKKISNELCDSKGISSWEELKNYIDKRISNWIGAVNTLGATAFSGPSETVQLITPCLYLMEEFKNKKVLGENCRLFIIIDQYETLYEHRNNIDFRPIFNLSMRQAARGGTSIEFKMGVRPYGYRDNLDIFGSGIRLDLMKECNEVFIDLKTEEYYDDFIEDLTIKCLKRHDIYKNIKKVEEVFEDLNPVEEVKKYVGGSTILNKHFSLFFSNYPRRDEIIAIIEDITKNIYLFSWNKIPGEDNEKFIEFLNQNYRIDWVKTAKIEKTENNKTISVFTERNSLALNLNDENTKANLIINKDETNDFIAITENGELNIYTNIIPPEYKVWIETILSIYVERYLKKKKVIDTTFLKSMLNEHLIILQSRIDECIPYKYYSRHTISRVLTKREYDSYRDIRSGALFLIAASYKNKPKIYCGYETLKLASSRIVLHYVQTVSEAFNFYLLENEEKTGLIPAVMQSSALYGRANKFFNSIPDTVPHGLAVSHFLKNLGILFRWLQLDPLLNKPYPNGFSVLNDLTIQFDSEIAQEIKIKTDIIKELLSYGFLEQGEHKDKRRYKYKRYKYYLNRLLCPYFGIPIPHRKDPLYIHDEKEFLDCLFQKECNINKLKKYLDIKPSEKETNSENLTRFLTD